jgi:predicted lactoylglutathione lyase
VVATTGKVNISTLPHLTITIPVPIIVGQQENNMTDFIIQIPITTDCDPSVLLDLAIEMGEQIAQEATRYGSVYSEATVDEDEILVRPAGLTPKGGE